MTDLFLQSTFDGRYHMELQDRVGANASLFRKCQFLQDNDDNENA